MKSKDNAVNSIRLQVFLSRNGVSSRRKAMEIIKQGSIKVNGEIVVEPSHPVRPGKDRVHFENRLIKEKRYDYILLNKPSGYTTTKQDKHAKKTVMQLLPKPLQHVSPVGRLDRDTEGLLLLTNDGDIANHLTHPRFDIDKTYFVMIEGLLSPEHKSKLERGVYVEGSRTAPAKLRVLKKKHGKTELEMTIHEGKKRQIRRMFAKLKYRVKYLKRLKQGPLKLGRLRLGMWRELRADEVRALQNL